MNLTQQKRGATLIEAVISLAALAIVVPLTFVALAASGKVAQSSDVETQSPWIVSFCADEITASRAARSSFFPATTPGEAFPKDGDVWALAFSPEGKAIARIGRQEYEQGISNISNQPARSIVALSTRESSTASPVFQLKISLEYPAGFPRERRQKHIFYSQVR